MSRPDDAIISELEVTLKNPTVRLTEQFKEDTKKALDSLNTRDADITLHAVIRSGTEAGVVKVARWKASDLYGDAPPRSLLFNAALMEILQLLMRLRGIDENDVDFELVSIDFWKKTSNLNRFLGTSGSHDEIIANIQQIICAHQIEPLNQKKVRFLITGFEILQNSPLISPQVLDSFYQTMELGGFDTDFSMSFLATTS